MKQKDPIIQNILDKRYEQEKQLYALEQQLMSLGYKLQDIQGNFMLDYIDSGKYTPEMESLVSKINTGLFCNTTARNVPMWQNKKKEISFLRSQLKANKKAMIYMNIASIIASLAMIVPLFSLLPSLPEAIFLICSLSLLACVYTASFLEVLSLNRKVSELNTEENELNEKIKKHTKVKENALFETYSMWLQTYLEDLYKSQNYKKSNRIEDKKKVLEMYKNILESMKPINKLESKPELVKSYILKR